MSTRPQVVSPPARTARRSTVVAVWTLVSRLTGLARVIVIGAVLGPTFFTNTFVTTNQLPNTIYAVVAGPALAMVVVPALVRVLDRGGTREASRLLGHLAGFLLAASLAVAGLLVLVSPAVARLLTFSIADDVTRARAEQVAVILILLMASQVVLYSLAALGAAAQQARHRFALAAAAPATENLALIGVVIAAGVVWGTGIEVAQVPATMLVALGVGSTVAVSIHTGLQLFGARRAGLPIGFRLRWRSDPDAVLVVRRLRASVSVPAAPAGASFALLVVASTVPGGVVVVQAAYGLFQLPIALGARAVSTAVLPGLSATAAGDDEAGFARSWRQALGFAVTTSLPPLVFLGVLSVPVAQLLAHGELRTDAMIEHFAVCIAVVAFAQVAAGLHEVGRQALFARTEITAPRRASLLLLVVTLATALIALLVPDPTARLGVLCGALLAGECAGALVVLARMRTLLWPRPFLDRRRVLAAAVAAVAMLPVVAVSRSLVDRAELDTVALFVGIGGGGALALAVYAGVLRAGLRLRAGGAP